MRAVQIESLTGPAGLVLNDVPVPEPDGHNVLVDVKAAGVSFPDLLLSQGLYQLRMTPPFTAGQELSGTVRWAPPGSGFVEGQRVCGTGMGAFADVAVLPPDGLFELPDQLSWEEGAALVLNYQTAMFCLRDRGRFAAGESLLVLGASGGVGTSVIQVAQGLGASRVIGLVSTPAKGDIARAAGADDIVLTGDTWKDEVLALTDGRGVDVCYDPVGGDRFLDGVRCLKGNGGRLVVVGFASGDIPEIRVNRLLLRNIEVIGAAWGEAMREDPTIKARLHADLLPLIESGHVKPPVGQVLPVEAAAEAYRLLNDREAVAKVVLTF